MEEGGIVHPIPQQETAKLALCLKNCTGRYVDSAEHWQQHKFASDRQQDHDSDSWSNIVQQATNLP